jgi:hypothetical protein
MDGKQDEPNDAPTRREAGDGTRRDEAETRRDAQDVPKAPPRYRDWASI